MSKKVIIIVGPTASGKTAKAVSLAQQLNTEIISADSRQCYKELKIGVARPSEEELATVKHHFIASHSITEEVNAAEFEKYALNKCGELFEKYDTIVMVGGTGLYIKAFCEGLDNIPEVPAEIRNNITRNFQQYGLGWLQNHVRLKDPEFYAKGEIHNPKRMMRALEVIETTGRSILFFRKGEKVKRGFDVQKIGIAISKEELHRNINSRVDKMMEAGLLDEVRNLVPFKHLNALQTVGYTELFEYLDGKHILEEAIEAIKKNTRQYAKRQLTWFKRETEIVWKSH